jgi:hypothetical protein
VLRFDFTQLLAVRQEIGDFGIVSAGLVFTGIAPSEVWSDPYKTSTDRDSSDRDSRGIRLGWERVLGSGFSADFTARKIDIEHEESGRSSTLTASQIGLLDRNGNSLRLRISYDWEFAPHHFLSPGLILGREDLDGMAMRHDVSGFKLDYGFNSGSDTFSASLYPSRSKAMKRVIRYSATARLTATTMRWALTICVRGCSAHHGSALTLVRPMANQILISTFSMPNLPASVLACASSSDFGLPPGEPNSL